MAKSELRYNPAREKYNAIEMNSTGQTIYVTRQAICQIVVKRQVLME